MSDMYADAVDRTQIIKQLGLRPGASNAEIEAAMARAGGRVSASSGDDDFPRADIRMPNRMSYNPAFPPSDPQSPETIKSHPGLWKNPWPGLDGNGASQPAPARVQKVPGKAPVGDFATRALASVWDMFQQKPQFTAQPAPQAEVGPPRTAMMPPSEGRVNRPKKGKGGGVPTPAAPQPGQRGALDGEVEKLAQEDEGVKEMKRLIGQYEKKREINLAPVIALVDSWTGSNLSQSYDRPMTDDERKKTVLSLKEAIVKREADARYKKSYLLAMAKQAETSRLNKQDELASRERLAHIAGGYKLKAAKAPDENKTPDRLLKVHQDSILYVAKKRHGDPKDPESKDFKAYKTRIHEEALDMAQWDVAQGKSPDMNTAYSAAMKELVDFPNGRDAAGAE